MPHQEIRSARTEIDGRAVTPLSYGWPRPTVEADFPTECVTQYVGFRTYVCLPAPLAAGEHQLDLVFLGADGLELGRCTTHFTTTQSIELKKSRFGDPTVDRHHSQAGYLDLLEKTLVGLPYAQGQELVFREDGRDWPTVAHSMAGMARLRHLRACVESVVREGIVGDLIETGVWRGGACILMRAVLRALGDTSRKVWVADSFAGLPKPDAEKYPADAGDTLYAFKELAVSQAQVRENFARYDLLDGQVEFLEGLFANTLPTAPIEKLSVLRLDGDMYESTMDAITALYPRLSVGGYCIVDDYGAVPACRMAVNDYRRAHAIEAPVGMIDWTGAWWRKE
ncbi:MAG: TylF/MycF family methyltransferase [Comamonadaceae bacterium]